MIDTEKGAVAGDAAGSSEKSKDKEKKKRSHVKQLLLTDVKKQVEFWFGDVNLHKDRFLRKLIDESDHGYVDLSVLASFNRMKNLTADTELIARALKNSSVVEINLEGNKVRRLHPIGDPPNDEECRTVYVELLPKDVTHNWIERVFSKCGNVVYISIPRHRSTGDSKGFAFVEFEKVDQAQKAIEMLNNLIIQLPEDAPRKPGIFPKTLRGKPLPMPPENHTSSEEEEKKEQPMEAESTGQKRKGEPEASRAQKTLGKEKKRRWSQTVDASEGELLSKIRKTSGSGTGEDSSKSSQQTKSNKKGEIKDEKENMDDLGIKAKRKRKRQKKHKEKEVIALRVLPKKEWLELKQEYLTLQKHSMANLKKYMTKIEHDDQKSQKDTETKQKDEKVSMEERNEKMTKQGPQFVSGVILKITDNKPLPGRKTIKEVLSKISPVAYIDTTEGDVEAHIRFNTPEDTKAVNAVKAELLKEHSWKIEILSGDHEQRYWQKILVDRQVQLNRPRKKKRGTEKLLSKAEKIIMARAKEVNKHLF